MPLRSVQSNEAGQAVPASGLRWWPWFIAAVGLLALTAALGDSASTPGLGLATGGPPWDLGLHPPSWLVSAMLVAAYLCGALFVLLGLRRVRANRLLDPRVVAVGALIAVGMLVLVPPTGSADHLSYVAYGRIAAAGDDPYVVVPLTWHGGTDPVADAIQEPWQSTPSVYGPVATAAQMLVAAVGGGSLRLTVWCWQLLCGVAFLAVGWVLDRMTGRDPAARSRAAVLWTLNPLLLGQLVLGAHVDVLAVALAIAGIALVARRPLLAGMLVGAAGGVKAPFALYAFAAVWGLWHLPQGPRWRAILLGLAGALAVLVPAYWWAGPHAGDQLGKAGERASFASPWHGPFAGLSGLLGTGVMQLLAPLALAVAVLLAVVLWRRTAWWGPVVTDEVAARAAGAVMVATVAWLLTAPYVLPWYDAIAWAPLALVGASALDRWLTIRLTVLALAYVPGRAVGLGPAVEQVTLGFRTYVAPVLLAAVIVMVVRWGRERAGPVHHLVGERGASRSSEW